MQPAYAKPSLALGLQTIEKRYPHTHFGIAIYDLDAHSMVYAQDADQFFVAASTTKLLTEGTALALLGPEYRFTTNVYRTGPIDAAGTLDGDAVLLASGDPNLSGRIQPDGTMTFENEDHSYAGNPDTKAVPGNPLAVIYDFAAQIAARGIKRIAGHVIVDDSLFSANYPESGTGVIVSPIVVNDNIVDIELTPGARPGDPVLMNVSPQTPYVTFVNAVTTGATQSERNVNLPDGSADASGHRSVTISGSMPAGSPSILYAYAVPSPRRFAEMALTAALQSHGVAVDQSAADSPPNRLGLIPNYQPANVIATHVSPPLSQDVKVTLKVSDNLHASMMPYIWSRDGKLRTAFDMERSFMQRGGLDTSQIVQNDGLGGNAFIQPSFMVQYLAYVKAQPFFNLFYASLPVLGVDGSLFNIANGSPAAGKVHAKTGTWGTGDLLNARPMITGKGLAGYMTTASGRNVAFCFYLNNLPFTHGTDASRAAGQINGELANAAYLYTP